MPYHRSTLRRYGEITRKYGKLLNELESVLRKGKNLLADINRLELNSKALAHATGEKPLSQEEAERAFPHLFKDE